MSLETPSHGERCRVGLVAPCTQAGERGSSLMEYCLLLSLIALVTISALTAFGAARDDVWTRAASSIAGP